jgi:cell shape-determining protein MreC
MAKALIGYLNSDLQTTTRLANENRRLRERVVDLEAIVLRLQEENDRLTATQAAALLDITSGALQEMQPV